jgi:membrane protein YdbS with pleckstrin-like domain
MSQTTPPPTQGPHAEPDDREEIYFQGSPPIRARIGMNCLYFLLAVVILAAAGVLIAKHMGPWWTKLALILLAVITVFVPTLLARSIRYRVSNYRIDYERGLLAKNIDTLELWHVEDLHFHQSLMDRVLNVGSITVVAHDDTLPALTLRGIPNPRPLYEMLKQRVIAVKRQRGVIKMDPG